MVKAGQEPQDPLPIFATAWSKWATLSKFLFALHNAYTRYDKFVNILNVDVYFVKARLSIPDVPLRALMIHLYLQGAQRYYIRLSTRVEAGDVTLHVLAHHHKSAYTLAIEVQRDDGS